MGLLDDAIREHLELKRRRGADPAEVARAEQDALGPVRRERDGADEPHEEPLSPALQEDVQNAPAASSQPLAPEEQTQVLPPRDDADRHSDPAAGTHGRRPDDDDGSGVPARIHDEPAAADTAAHAAPAGDDAAPTSPETARADAPGRERSEIVDQATTEYRLDELHDADADAAAAAAAAAPPARQAETEPPPPSRPAPPARDSDQRRDEEDEDEHGDASDDVLEETPDFLQETPEHDRLWFEQRAPRDFDFDG